MAPKANRDRFTEHCVRLCSQEDGYISHDQECIAAREHAETVAELRKALKAIRAALNMYADGPMTEREMVISRVLGGVQE